MAKYLADRRQAPFAAACLEVINVAPIGLDDRRTGPVRLEHRVFVDVARRQLPSWFQRENIHAQRFRCRDCVRVESGEGDGNRSGGFSGNLLQHSSLVRTSGIGDYLTTNKQIAAVTGIGAALFVTGLGFVGVGKTIGLVATAMASVLNAAAIGNVIATAFSTVVSAIDRAISAVYRFLAGFTEFRILFGTIGVITAAVRMLGNTLFFIANSLIKPAFSTIFGIFLQLEKIALSIAATIGSVLILCFLQILRTAGTVFAAIGSVVVTSFIRAVYVIGGVVSRIGSLIGHALSPVLALSARFFGASRR